MDSQIYQSRRKGYNIIDHRFEGRSLEVYTVDGERLIGLVDEVAVYEIGMYVENVPIIVERSSILYMVSGLSDLHGSSECCEKEYVLDEDFIGVDVELRLINGQEIGGRIVKITKNEIGIAQGNRALIIPRSKISFIKVGGR